MFDFLQDGESRRNQNVPEVAAREESVVPIIRKPVPVEQSALDDLRAKQQSTDEFDFLDGDRKNHKYEYLRMICFNCSFLINGNLSGPKKEYEY